MNLIIFDQIIRLLKNKMEKVSQIKNVFSHLKRFPFKIKVISFDLDDTLFSLKKVLQNASKSMYDEMRKYSNGKQIAD